MYLRECFKTVFYSLFLFAFCLNSCNTTSSSQEKYSMIYSTDMFQPPDDPDDHYDWAILNKLGEIDVKAVIFDLGSAKRDADEVAVTALKQISLITGKDIPPYAIGLRNDLTSTNDQALNQPEVYQKGVDLILQKLRDSQDQVILFLVGSCRDFAVAFNREPELLRQKVKAVYINAGNGNDGIQDEWNVTLDPIAYEALLKSGLPMYWCPCFGKTHQTHYIVENQAELLSSCTKEMKNYFSYALNRATDDPIGYIEGVEQKLPDTERHMWCTGPFIHASGRKIYQESDGKYIACTPAVAKQKGISDNEVEVFCFEKVKITFEPEYSENGLPIVRLSLNETDSNIEVFRYVHPEYNEILTKVLAGMLSE